jgi:hypothetical protein
MSRLAPVFVEGRTGDNGYIGESAVVVVVIQDARSAVAGHINVRPSVIVVVEGGDTEGIMTIRLVNVRLGGNVFKPAIAAVMIENVLRSGQAARAAHHRRPFPNAGRPFSGGGRGGKIEIHIIGYDQIEKPVTVVIYESAT